MFVDEEKLRSRLTSPINGSTQHRVSSTNASTCPLGRYGCADGKENVLLQQRELSSCCSAYRYFFLKGLPALGQCALSVGQ